MKHLAALLTVIQMHLVDVRDAAKDRGATATEYALLVAFIAIAILVGVTAFGDQLNSFFQGLSARVTQ